MEKDEGKYLLVLRIFLFCAALAWGVSVLGLILPWSIVADELRGLGAKLNEPDIMVQYWLKMAAAVYTLAGCFFALAGIRPYRYQMAIKPIGWLHIILGISFLINGQLLGVEPIPLCVDAGFCLCVGGGILATWRKLWG